MELAIGIAIGVFVLFLLVNPSRAPSQDEMRRRFFTPEEIAKLEKADQERPA